MILSALYTPLKTLLEAQLPKDTREEALRANAHFLTEHLL